MNTILQTGLLVLTLFLVINVTIINLVVLRSHNKTAAYSVQVSDPPPITPVVCDSLCQKNVADMMAESIPTSIPTKLEQPSIRVSSQREHILPLGSGKTSSREWQEIPGAEIEINTENYPNILEVVFEAYLSIPNASGFAHAKLVNVTDKHDVWFSEVSMETDKVTGKEAKITLDSGKKRYRVSLKSSLGADIILHNARVKIITKS